MKDNKNEEKSVFQQLARPEVKVDINIDEERKATFRIVRWSPTKVFERLPELGSVLAIPAVMYSAAEENAGLGVLDGERSYEEGIAMALMQLFNGLDQKNLSEFIKKILDDVYTESGYSVKDNFDEIFKEHPELVIDLLAATLEANYGPFFKRGFKNLLNPLRKVAELNRI